MIHLHDHSCGSGQLVVRRWLAEVVAERLPSGRNSNVLTVVTRWGKSREARQTGDLQDEVLHLLRGGGIAFEAHPRNPGRSAVAPGRLQALFPSVGARENKRFSVVCHLGGLSRSQL